MPGIMRYLLLMIAGMMMLSACQSEPQATDVNMTPGQRVFADKCLMCHQGTGGKPNPVVLNSRHLASEDVFRDFLRDPNVGMMPAFPESRLSNDDLALLYEYLMKTASEL